MWISQYEVRPMRHGPLLSMTVYCHAVIDVWLWSLSYYVATHEVVERSAGICTV
jgi:hypothetical protein